MFKHFIGTSKEQFFYHNTLLCLVKAFEGKNITVDLRDYSKVSGEVSIVDGDKVINASSTKIYDHILHKILQKVDIVDYKEINVGKLKKYLYNIINLTFTYSLPLLFFELKLGAENAHVPFKCLQSECLRYMNISFGTSVFCDANGNEFLYNNLFVQGRNIRYIHIPEHIPAVETMKNELNQNRLRHNNEKPPEKSRKAQKALKRHMETVASIQEKGSADISFI